MVVSSIDDLLGKSYVSSAKQLLYKDRALGPHKIAWVDELTFWRSSNIDIPRYKKMLKHVHSQRRQGRNAGNTPFFHITSPFQPITERDNGGIEPSSPSA